MLTYPQLSRGKPIFSSQKMKIQGLESPLHKVHSLEAEACQFNHTSASEISKFALKNAKIGQNDQVGRLYFK